MTNSVTSFLDTIRESRVLEPGRLEELLRTPDVQSEGVDAPMLGACLVQLGWLTEYQVGELLKGQGGTLLVGPYRLLERLGTGEGKFGPGFKASHPDKDGRFAVKVVGAEAQANNDGVRGRFLDEVRKAGTLAHPNIARVAEAESQDSRTIYAREYFEGIDLAGLVAQHGPLPVGYACDYIHQAAQGLQHAHERGLAHGHLKASNLIVSNTASLIGAATADGAQSAGLPPVGSVVKIVDFGFGSLYHPESATPQRDLVALGDLFTFLLTGQVDGTLTGDVTVAVGKVIQKLRSQTPGETFASAADAVRALAPLCGNEPAPTELPAAAMPALDLSAEPAPAPKWDAAPVPSPVAAPAAAPVATPAAAPVPPRPAMPLPPPPPPVGTGPAKFVPPAMAAPIAPTPIAAPVAEESPAPTEEPRAPGKPKKKWTTRDWMLVGVGLVLHLFAAVIIIVLVMNYLNSQSNKGTPKPPPRQTAPKTKAKGPGMGSVKPAFDGREEFTRFGS